jgi:hypothetical protein
MCLGLGFRVQGLAHIKLGKKSYVWVLGFYDSRILVLWASEPNLCFFRCGLLIE